MTRIRVDYADLLGVKHLSGALELRQGGLDCAGVAAEVIRRVLGTEARDAFLGLLRGQGADWVEVMQPDLQLGDVVASTVLIDGQQEPHVGAIVNLWPPMVLTSSKKLGVFATRLSAVSRMDRILRYPGSRS